MSLMPIYYTEEELDDLIDKWHNGDGKGLELYEYVGVSREDYAKWVMSRNNKLLKPLVTNKQTQVDK